MLTRILCILALCASLVYAADNPSASPASLPTEPSVKQLLEVAQAHKLVDSVMAQMDSLMQQTIARATKGQPIPDKVQKNIDQRRSEVLAMMKDLLDWKKLEPMYVRIYQKTFTQQEIDGMIAFYKTPAGQAVINKMPATMQNTIDEMQQMMGPVMQKMQQMQQEVAAELKAESKNKGG
ncbi:MAG TPA: DUF2059 domain-containing protein [Chthoniobacterales bacterium]|jgi:hypothetical protein|nr:DUF2059 domain-containing protein [Chthoniobacterales bacterium]